jgi:hypothetical protein
MMSAAGTIIARDPGNEGGWATLGVEGLQPGLGAGRAGTYFVTEQVTVFSMANANAIVKLAYDAGMATKAVDYAHAVAVTPSEWRKELGVEPANGQRSKREVDQDVRRVVQRLAPGVDFSSFSRVKDQGAWDACAIALAWQSMLLRANDLAALVEHHRMPRQLGKLSKKGRSE